MSTSISVGTLNPPALTTKTPSNIRDELMEMVIRDLLGPAGGPDEELNQFEDHAYQRYLVGMLAPKDTINRTNLVLAAEMMGKKVP